MSRHPHDPGAEAATRVAGILAAVALMIAVVLSLGGRLERNEAMRVHVAEPVRPPLTAPDRPIAAEAGVFRIRPGGLAVAPDAERRREAHPRTLAMHRAQRAYPGAPPPIPHGLTDQELRDQSCNTCHERGGFVPRFSAYVPVTPHPDMVSCLQCHAPKDAVVGVTFPSTTGDVCSQCHAPGAEPAPFDELDWAAPSWPVIDRRPLPGGPPVIPHALYFRNNCLSCHGGPGAVEEIRTTHPERANCRQCHVLNPTETRPPQEVFTRPLDAATSPGGGMP